MPVARACDGLLVVSRGVEQVDGELRSGGEVCRWRGAEVEFRAARDAEVVHLFDVRRPLSRLFPCRLCGKQFISCHARDAHAVHGHGLTWEACRLGATM